ncbi:MAG: hypothetical protein CL940_03515 [Deltaproteobacteria bacterium]|nr:hypothetical protein [Deltaproteobacteria bacterium]
MGITEPGQDPQIAVRRLVHEALRTLEPSPQGWTVDTITWRERDLVVVRVTHAVLGAFAVEVFDQPSDRSAYARGPVYGASTRRGPGLLDMGEEATPDATRALAYGLCSAIGALESGPGVTQPAAGPLKAPEAGLSGEPLASVLREALSQGAVPGLEDWQGPRVSIMTRWGEVAEVAYTRAGASLAFIISPRDDNRQAFAKGHAYELVYYSDDLRPDEHEALYARDTHAIESFARWFRSWDRPENPS